MKKSLRLVFAAAVLMTVAPVNMFAAVGGTNPHPQVSATTVSVNAVVSMVLSVLGF
jgi:hypothetical protein